MAEDATGHTENTANRAKAEGTEGTRTPSRRALLGWGRVPGSRSARRRAARWR